MTFAPVELQVTTNFSFLQGGSHPHELALQAAALGYEAIGVADRNTLAGVVRAYDGCNMAKDRGAAIRLIVGCRLDLQDAPSLLCYPEDRAAYGRLCTLLTIGKRRTEKGKCLLKYEDVLDHRLGQQLVALVPDEIDESFAEFLRTFRNDVGKSAHLAASHLYRGDDARRIRRIAELGRRASPASDRDQRRALSRAGAAPAAGRHDLHPRACDHRGSRLPPAGQCRAPSEIARRDAAAVQALAAGAGERRAPGRCLPLLARRAALRISERAGAGRPHPAAASGAADLGRRRQALSRRHPGQGPRHPRTGTDADRAA